MLSATTTQSPLATQSSVFTMPSVTMGSAGLNLTDHLFLPGVTTLDTSQVTPDLKSEQNGMQCRRKFIPWEHCTKQQNFQMNK